MFLTEVQRAFDHSYCSHTFDGYCRCFDQNYLPMNFYFDLLLLLLLLNKCPLEFIRIYSHHNDYFIWPTWRSTPTLYSDATGRYCGWQSSGSSRQIYRCESATTARLQRCSALLNLVIDGRQAAMQHWTAFTHRSHRCSKFCLFSTCVGCLYIIVILSWIILNY